MISGRHFNIQSLLDPIRSNPSLVRGGQDILDIKDKIIVAHCSSGYKGAVQEVLTDEEIVKTIRDTKALREIRVLAKFHKMINLDISR